MSRFTIAPYGVDTAKNPYPPNPTQLKTLDWVDRVRANPDAKKIPVLYIQGGVGSGKSRALLAPVQEMLLEIPLLRVLWGRQDFKDIKLSIMDKFFETFPSELIVNKSEQYHWYDVKTEGIGSKPSRIYFNGLKDLSGFGSQEFGVIVITEAHETTEHAYRTLKRRCRQENAPNMILLEGEPPNEGHWLSRLTDPNSDDFDSDIEKWEISTYENWDNLPQAYRGSLEGMPEAWKRKYLYGKTGFIPAGRPFYEGFSESIHTGDFEFISSKPLILGWDFGYHHPAVNFSQFGDNGTWYILRELMGSEITIDQYCDRVTEFINTNFPNAKTISYGDPACMQKNDKSERTSWDVCRSRGFHVKIKASTYRLRKELIEGKLLKMIRGRPTLMVDHSCKTIIDGFLGGYHYPEIRPGQAVGANYETPFHDDFYSHLMNSVEYVAINSFRPIEISHDTRRTRLYRSRLETPQNAGFGF